MIVNSKVDAILRKAIDNKKAVVVRFPPDLWLKAQKKQSRMIDEAADRGDTSTISIHSVVLEAVSAFVEE
jgi:hypothetical protein